ncbi:MAG: hypothetical protein M3512_14200 [Bacteroidota bacterium]|nr:hypothetical protein [Bacteroidota bacterium]
MAIDPDLKTTGGGTYTTLPWVANPDSTFPGFTWMETGDSLLMNSEKVILEVACAT